MLSRYANALCAAGVMLAPAAATGQTIFGESALNVLTVGRLAADKSTPVDLDRTTRLYWVNRAECASDQWLRINFESPDTEVDQLTIYAADDGENCLATSDRPPACKPIFDDQPGRESGTSYYALVSARDIVGSQKSATYTSPGDGTADDCESQGGSKLEFTFVGENNGERVASGVFSQSQADEALEGVGYDAEGPDAPADLTAEGGENRILFDWNAAEDEDIRGYRFYCIPAGSAALTPLQPLLGRYMLPAHLDGGVDAAAGGAPAGTGGIGGTVGTGATSMGGATTGGVAAGAAAAVAGGPGVVTSPDGGAAPPTLSNPDGGATVGTSACGAGQTALVPGQVPSEAVQSAFECGRITGNAGSGRTSGDYDLANGQAYDVGVATVDDVGNIGPLSDLACATPQVVDSFFELYKRAGGPGGGGFCATRPGGSGGSALLLGVALAAAAATARRRRP